MPASLYYSSSTIKNTAWAGTQEQREKYVEEYYAANNDSNNPCVYAAAGLLYNFKSVVFNVKSENGALSTSTLTEQKGGYRQIVNNGTDISATDNVTAENLFMISGLADGVREVSLKDLTGANNSNTVYQERVAGLYRLDNYESGYSGSAYWLSSPGGIYTNPLQIEVNGGGSFKTDKGVNGLRPVILLKSVTMKKEGNVWHITK